MKSDATWRGRCQCNDIELEFVGTPDGASLCHCQSCRDASGAPLLAWCTFPRKGMRMVSGQLTTYRSSPQVERGFCGHCGTTLTYAHDDLPDEIDVTTCALDEAARIAPIQHIWIADKLAWVSINDDLPQYDGWSQRNK